MTIMAEDTKSTTTTTTKSSSPNSETAKSSGDLGASQIQGSFDEANEKGYFGETVDETPNEDYTVDGVNAAKAKTGKK